MEAEKVSSTTAVFGDTMFANIVISLALIGAIHAEPWETIPIDDPSWLNLHDQFVNNTISRGSEIKAVFYGDSITRGWLGYGKPIYDAEYAPLGTANYGIAGDRVENVIWRIINGEVAGLKPKVVVLKIGTNNPDPSDNVVIGTTALVNELRQRLPGAKILLLGILPRSDTDSWFSRMLREMQINAAASGALDPKILPVIKMSVLKND